MNTQTLTKKFTTDELPSNDKFKFTGSNSISNFNYNADKISNENFQNKNRIRQIGIGTAGTAAGIAVLTYSEQASAAPDPSVQAVVTTITDTIPLLTRIAMLVLSAGLAPWAARTCLQWLSSILRGAL